MGKPIKIRMKRSISFFPDHQQVTYSEKKTFSNGILYRSFSYIWRPKDAVMGSSRSVHRLPAVTAGSVETSIDSAPGKGRILWKLFFVTVCIALLPNLFGIGRYKYNSLWPLTELEESMKSNIFGQRDATIKLIDALNRIFLNDEAGVIVLTGGVGVGKSLAANLIQNSYPWKNDIYFRTADILSYEDLHKPIVKNLLIIEDCRLKDREKISEIVHKLLADAKATKNQIIILIIFSHRTEHELSSFLSSIRFMHFLVPFKDLEREDIRNCIRKQFEKEKIELSEVILDKLVEKQMKYVEISKSTPGCKQVDALSVQWKNFIMGRQDSEDYEVFFNS